MVLKMRSCVFQGNVDMDDVNQLAQKYFGPIPAREKYVRSIPSEPKQDSYRELTVKRGRAGSRHLQSLSHVRKSTS